MARDVILQPVRKQPLQATHQFGSLQGIDIGRQFLDGERDRRVVFLVPLAKIRRELKNAFRPHQGFLVPKMVDQIHQQVSEELAQLAMAFCAYLDETIPAATATLRDSANLAESLDTTEQQPVFTVDFGVTRQVGAHDG